MTGTKNDLLERCAEVRLRITEPGHNPFRPRRGPVEERQEQRPELGRDRHDPHGMPVVPFRLGAPHGKTTPFPVHIAPLEAKMLRRATHAREADQGDDHPPLVIWARGEHGLDDLDGDVERASGVGLRTRPQILERVHADQVPLDRLAEDRLGNVNALCDRRWGEAFIDDGLPPAVRISGFQFRDGRVPPEVPAETVRGLAVGVAC